MNPVEIAKALENVLSRDDIDDVSRCVDDKIYNHAKAVDLLLYKLLHQKDSSWYDALREAIEYEESDLLLPAILKQAQSDVLQQPAFSYLKGEFNILAIEDEGT
jgi:hypothetical protein